MNVKRIVVLISLIMVSSVFISCALLPRAPIKLKEPEDENISLVVGYVNMEDAPSGIYNAYMERLDKKVDYVSVFAVNAGLDGFIFFHSHAKPGVYRFTKFVGSDLLGYCKYTYGFPPQGKKDMDPVIKEPGIYFVGSYKYKVLKEGRGFEKTEFDVVRTDTPTEKEVWEEMLKHAKNTSWEKKILNRIKELEK
jgi:hypothetical protein